jgi:hypothetical protein
MACHRAIRGVRDRVNNRRNNGMAGWMETQHSAVSSGPPVLGISSRGSIGLTVDKVRRLFGE